jgi:glycosyltransferase involved in cell wall biosynthesis
MDRGGIETWLMHVLRRIDRRRLLLDFLVHTATPGAFDEEIVERQARLLRCTQSWRSPGYAREISSLLGQSGPYDAIHSHVHHFSGFLMRLARRCGVPIRIAHSHSDTSGVDEAACCARRLYLRLSERWIHEHATHLVGVSAVAGRALFGEQWSSDPRSRLLHCGIDLEPFGNAPAKAAARAALKIGEHDMVIGHVGRFTPPKNHALVLQVAAAVIRRQPHVRLLLVGDGPLRGRVMEWMQELGIGERVILTGIRADVPSVLAAMDIFLFPSLYEGLPLTLVEAQAAGLPCVISDAISREADVVPALIERVAPEAGTERWADAVLRAAGRRLPARDEAALSVENSSFNISESIEALYALYGC